MIPEYVAVIGIAEMVMYVLKTEPFLGCLDNLRNDMVSEEDKRESRALMRVLALPTPLDFIVGGAIYFREKRREVASDQQYETLDDSAL